LTPEIRRLPGYGGERGGVFFEECFQVILSEPIAEESVFGEELGGMGASFG
jgi:hypothetical protein